MRFGVLETSVLVLCAIKNIFGYWSLGDYIVQNATISEVQTCLHLVYC